jgi:ankyrin repeat protein
MEPAGWEANIYSCASLLMTGFNGQLPLHRACLRGDVDIVRLLIRRGADPNGKNDFEETALHFACKRGNPVLLRELIEHGADVRAEDRAGKGALHHAAHTGSV